MVDAFHVKFSAIGLIGQCLLQNVLDFNVTNGATLIVGSKSKFNKLRHPVVTSATGAFAVKF